MNGSCVYFLGAGASVGAGVPVTDKLLVKILRRLDQTGEQSLLREFCKIFDFRTIREGERPPVVEAM